MTIKTATPADAKEAWEGMMEPSARLVATALEAKGLPVSFHTVARWKRDGWTANPRSVKKNTPEQVIEAVAPALIQAPRPDADVTFLEVEPTPLTEPPEQTVERACREAAHTATTVLRQVAHRPDAYMGDPKNYGALLKAGSEVLKRAVDGYKQLQSILGTGATVIDAIPNLSSAQPIENHPLRESIEAWKRIGRPSEDAK